MKSQPPDNPFLNVCYSGRWMGDCTSADRIRRVREFNLDQCKRALNVENLQKTVITALERRVKQLEASK